MMTSINNKYQENKTIFIIIGVVSLVLVLVGVYYFYNYVSDRNVTTQEIKEILDSVQDAQDEMEISAGQIPISKYSNEYGISIWFKVDSYTYRYGQEKVILKRGDEKYGTPEIILAPKDNKLIVRTKLQHPVDDLNSASSESFADISLPDNVNVKETFKAFSGTGTQLAPIDEDMTDIGNSVSNNSAPVKSQQYHNSYFDMVSGNHVEGFQNSDEGNDSSEVASAPATIEQTDTNVEADVIVTKEHVESELLKLCLSVCRLLSDKKMNRTAISMYQQMEEVLNKVVNSNQDEIRSMFRTRTNLEQPTSNQIAEGMEDMPSNLSNIHPELESLDKMNVLFNSLIRLEERGESLNIEEIVGNVNEQLEGMDCDFKLVGNTTDKFVSNTVKRLAAIIKESLYLLIYQLGEIIKNNNPSLMGKLDNTPSYVDECIVESLPLQRWINLIVSQYNDTITIYVDGQLVSSCVLKGFPEIREEGVSLCPGGGFEGKISRLSFYNTAITQNKAYQIYRAGGNFSNDLTSNIPQWLIITMVVIIVGLLSYALFM
jgi:disulfide bond formation protein DsbB